MNKKLLWMVLLIAALLIPTAAVMAKGLSAMDVSGPGIDGTMRMDDLGDMEDIMRSGFFDASTRIVMSDKLLEGLGEGYLITYYFSEEPGQDPFHVEQVVYYPDPEGGKGYQHWIGGGATVNEIEPADQWTRVDRGESAFWKLMAANGVMRPEISVAAAPAGADAAVNEPVKIEAQPEAAEAVADVPPADSSTVSAPAQGTASPGWVWIAAIAVLVVLVAAAGVVFRQRGKREESLVASD